MVGSVGLALAILFYVTIFMLPTKAEAKSKAVAIEGISYNVNSSLADNLKSLIDTRFRDFKRLFACFVLV